MYARLIVPTALALFAAGVCAQPTNAPSPVVTVDRVIAIVNDEAVTQYELDEARRVVQQQLKQQKVQSPPADVLDKQVLERLITQRALLQQAKEDGVKIDDSQVERAIQRIATENKLSAEEFRKVLAQENIPYTKYRDDIRNEMVVQRLREREVDSKVQVSDAEVDQYLATLKAQNAGETEYRIAHILVMVPEQASRGGAAVDQERRGLRPDRRVIFRRERRASGRQPRLALRRAPADGFCRHGARAEGRHGFGGAAQCCRFSHRQAAGETQPR